MLCMLQMKVRFQLSFLGLGLLNPFHSHLFLIVILFTTESFFLSFSYPCAVFALWILEFYFQFFSALLIPFYCTFFSGSERKIKAQRRYCRNTLGEKTHRYVLANYLITVSRMSMNLRIALTRFLEPGL